MVCTLTMTSVYNMSVHCQFWILIALSSNGTTLAVGRGGFKLHCMWKNEWFDYYIEWAALWSSYNYCCHKRKPKERLLAGDMGRTGFIEEDNQWWFCVDVISLTKGWQFSRQLLVRILLICHHHHPEAKCLSQSKHWFKSFGNLVFVTWWFGRS